VKPKPSDREPPTPARVWTLSEARVATPYIASIVRSIREHALEVRAQRRLVKRLAGKPGLPTRNDLIACQDAEQAARQADEHLRDAMEELRLSTSTASIRPREPPWCRSSRRGNSPGISSTCSTTVPSASGASRATPTPPGGT